jgi:photosystem II stability/assembly factor-like uncharacterized protein
MKKYYWIIFFIFILLFSCKSKEKTTLKSEKTNIWKKLESNPTYSDLLNKFSKSTETYWFGSGRISSIWANPNDSNNLWIGNGFSNIFETKDGGQTWKNITENTPVLEVKKILKKDDIFYISTGYRFKNPLRFSAIKGEFYGYGVLSSKDKGKTWSKPSGNFYCADFSISKNHQIAYAIDTKNVYKSTDSVQTFKKIYDFKAILSDKGELINVVVHPENPQIVIVSSAFANKENSSALFLSVDGGKTFIDKTAIFKKFAPKPASDLNYYIKDVSLFYDESNSVLYVHFSVAYPYKGKSKKEYFKIKHLVLKSKNFYDFKLELIQDKKSGLHYIPTIQKIDSILFLKDWYLKMKTPSDKKFKNIGQGKTHQDTRSVAVTKSGVIYYGNDAGLFKSIDNGDTFTDAFPDLNSNLIIEAGYYSDKDKRRIAFGTQDCGFYLNDFNEKPNYPIATHEGGIYLSKHNVDRVYTKGRHIKISTDGGKKFRTIKMNNRKPLMIWHDDGLLVEDPVSQHKLYASHYDGLYVSDSLGVIGTWKSITPKNKLNGRGISLAISKTNPNILYYANVLISVIDKNAKVKRYIYQGHLLKSTNGGKNWQNIGNSINNLLTEKAIISTVIVSDKNPDKVWITLRNNIEGKKVYFSDNGGVTWQNISYNLPNVPVNRIVFDSKSEQLYLGNDLGVFVLKNKDWVPFGKKLPKVIITSMFVDNFSNKLIISSFGQGIWQISLKN